MRIGVPREPGARETRVAATPATVVGLIDLGATVVVEPGAGERASFTDDAYAAAGAEIGDPWSADVVLALRTPDAEHLDRLAPGTTLVAMVGPARNPDLLADLARARHHGPRHRRRPAHLAGAVAGRAELDGQHRGLPRGGRGRAPLRPLLHRAGHRRGQGAAGQGARRRGRASPASPRSGRRPASAPSCGPPTRDPRSPSRSAPWVGTSSPSRCDAGGEHRRVRPRDLRGLRRPGRRDLHRAGRGRRRRHHHRADPGPRGAAAAHRRRRRAHEARQRRRGHGRGPGRQRRGLGGRRGRRHRRTA